MMQARRLGKARTLAALAMFVSEPLSATRRLHRDLGPFLVAELPHSTRTKPRRLFLVADARLYKEMLTDTEVWRNTQINARGRKDHASNRLSQGMTRLRGERHEHYRRLIAPPLKRPEVAAMSPRMADIAGRQVESWALNRPVAMVDAVKTMAQHLAVGLLFGDDLQRALPIAEMIARQIDASWVVPGKAFLGWVRQAEAQEHAILAWAEEKRRKPPGDDILSILVSNPDESGNPPSAEIIGGLVTFVFGAAYDTCQNALAWALILLAHHPEHRERLIAEIDAALDGCPATIDRIGSLPMLEWVVREAMRLFPPVPLQMRRATQDTRLGNEAVSAGERAIICALAINREEGLYPAPDDFRPERWAKLKPSPFQYTVFGAGGHMCPGVTFGLQMMKIALATILSRRAFSLSPASRIGYRTRITLAPTGTVDMVLRERPAPPAPAANAPGGFRRLVRLPQDDRRGSE